MKKTAIILTFIFILMPIFVKAEMTCKYSKSSHSNIDVILYFESNGTKYHLSKTEVASSAASGQTMISYIKDGSSVKSIRGYDYIIESCPSKICLNSPISSGVLILDTNCSSNAEHWEFLLNSGNNDTEVEIESSPKYDGVKICQGYGEYIQECGCVPAALTDITSRLYFLLKIIAPALLLIIGGFDLIKAMGAQDEKAIKKAQEKLVKKLIAAAAVFLIFTIIQFVISVLSSDSNDTLICVKYFIDGYVF